jgi:kumamolisin
VHSARSTGGSASRIGLAAILVAALAVLAASASVGAASAGGYVSVSQGAGSAPLPSYTPFGTTDPSTPETVSFILRARNVDQLQAQVQAGMPHGFLSVNDFARQYGQPQLVIVAIQVYLGLFGIHSHAMANDLVIQSTGTAGQYNKAFQVVQQNFQVPAVPAHNGRPGQPARTVHGSVHNPKVPSSIGGIILAVLGLSNYPTQQSDMIGQPSDATTASSHGSTPLPNTALLPGDFATRYDLTPVQAAHGTGAGRTIGIVTLASVKTDVVSDFWSYIGLTGSQASASRITPINVDGGAGPASDAVGSDETALDAEQSGALAPNANVRVYQAPNTDFGFVDAFFQAASDNVADSVSASWGESETYLQAATNSGVEDPNYTASFDEAFLELAAQGQSAFVSSGDEGAYGPARDLGSTNLATGNPDDSPWVTSSGGTTLPGPVSIGVTAPCPTNAPGDLTPCPTTTTIPAERTWGWDWLWALEAQRHSVDESVYALNPGFDAGSGGGYSVLESMPGYQQAVRGAQNFSAVEYLTPIDYVQAYGLNLPTDWDFNPAPAITQGTGTGRATPDLSTDADPETGYQVLYTFGDGEGDPGAPPTIEQFGGTSFVAPQLNGTTAVIDSALGRRVGFWNPAIYQFAGQHNSPFTPLNTSGTTNDNLYYTGTHGNVYNVGSGLGVPDFAKLASDFGSNH